MVELNPTFAETLQTNGARGGNFWLYVKGACPPSCILFLRDGQRFGEWRGSGMQTIIAGTHPCGRPYTNNGHKPITAEFGAIGWLEIVALPWDMKRPGVSMEFLVAHGVRYVGAEEAKTLLGFKPSGGGLWIPYPKLEGEGPLMVNGREYGCLRLYKPDHDAKYLTPRDSGSQLYVPANGGPFGRELVLCEGEFKALALCEAGVRAVAIRGISSAMPGGKMLPDLKQLLTKFPLIKVLYFLGDADTALNFNFSLEAIKLVRALPTSIELRLPRIPVGGGNGIDDCRHELGNGKGFVEFWERIKNEAVKVSPKSEASAIATEVLLAQLPAIALNADWKRRFREGIVGFARELKPMALDELAATNKKHLGINVESFKKEVASSKTGAADFVPRNGEEAEIVAKCGAPYSINRYGELLINERFFASIFVAKHRVLFDVNEGRFYLYNAGDGAWHCTDAAIIKRMVSDDYHMFARQENLEELDRQGSSRCVNAVTDLLKSQVAVEGAFKPRFATLHCKNGMLEITEQGGHVEAVQPRLLQQEPDSGGVESGCEVPAVYRCLAHAGTR